MVCKLFIITLFLHELIDCCFFFYFITSAFSLRMLLKSLYKPWECWLWKSEWSCCQCNAPHMKKCSWINRLYCTVKIQAGLLHTILYTRMHTWVAHLLFSSALTTLLAMTNLMDHDYFNVISPTSFIHPMQKCHQRKPCLCIKYTLMKWYCIDGLL